MKSTTKRQSKREIQREAGGEINRMRQTGRKMQTSKQKDSQKQILT